ncbi:MAG: KdsC family phosphatase [Leptospirillia bacterium]
MERFSQEIIDRAARVRLLILDVDGVLTDGTIYLDNEGTEIKGFNIMDGLGLNLLKNAGIRIGIITGRTSGVVSCRAAELGIKLLVQGCGDKLQAAEEMLAGEGLSLDETAFVGDDLIDLKLMGKVGLSVSVPGGSPEARALAHHVTCAHGGHGAVREVCELILKSQGLWDKELARFQ